MISFYEFLKIVAEDAIPGNAPPQKQVHVFDFDETLGVTDNANGVMLYANGNAAHTTKDQALQWLKSMGLGNQDLLKGPSGQPIEYVPARKGFVVYISSAGLAAIQRNYPRSQQFVTGFSEPAGKGEEVLIDFTPSSNVNKTTTKPIAQTIQKLKQANAAGADTMVLTARKSSGDGVAIDGKTVTPTNKQDMEEFLGSQGAAPTQGVEGVSGQNKGLAIAKKFISGKNPNQAPEEIHFYDDLAKNTQEVEDAIGGKVPAELHIYGPGEFEKGHANAFKPSKSHDKKLGKK
jgi:hypothetical protein